MTGKDVAGPADDTKQTMKKKENNVVTIVCPPERHIAIDFQELYSVVKTSMTVGQRQRYEEVCKLLESLYAQEYMTMRRNIKHNFLAFSVGARCQELATRKGRSLPPKADLDIREERLVGDFLQLMAAARFSLLSKKEWEQALSETFLFNLPVEVNWDFFDARLLTRFWGSEPDRRRLRESLPDAADRVLVFVRGIGIATDSGLYVNEKIDLLVEYLVVTPLSKAWGWIKSKFSRGKKPAPASRTGSAVGGADVPGGAAGAAVNGTDGAADVSGAAMMDEEDLPRHRATVYVERRTLNRLLPTVWSVIKSLPKNMQLQEPMYKEVIVLYRTKGTGRMKKLQGPVRARSTTDRLRDILARRNVHIKRFHDIPMADLDAIFPDKKVYLKTLSIISMLVQAITAFVAAMAGLWRAGHLDFKAVQSALSLVAARCGQLYSGMQAERSKMIQNMVNLLYDKTSDAQEGVLSMLLEDMAEQQLKEAVLAYTMLYLNIEDEVTQDALDGMCERFLEDEFDLKLDFAVEDALPRLVQWGLVRHNMKTDRYQALTLDTAYASLNNHWQVAPEALSRPPTQKLLPLTALLTDGDRTPTDNPFALTSPRGVHVAETLEDGGPTSPGATPKKPKLSLFKRKKSAKA